MYQSFCDNICVLFRPVKSGGLQFCSCFMHLFSFRSILLDQLMRYEPIILTDEEDELTDYSPSEDEMMNTSVDHSQFPSKV